MNKTLVKTLDTDCPAAQAYARWAAIELYADIMPSLRGVKRLSPGHWQWDRDDGVWAVDAVVQQPGRLIRWRAVLEGDEGHECQATVLFTPSAQGTGVRLVYTQHYPQGLPPGLRVEEIEAEMLTTLRRSAGLIDRPADVGRAAVAQALGQADEAAEAALAQVVESGEMLQATLSRAANAWARAMTDSLTLVHQAMGVPPSSRPARPQAPAGQASADLTV